jgi:hypothetical protein
VPVHAVFPSKRYLSAKVRAFIDLALERFPSDNAEALQVTARACGLHPGKPTPHCAVRLTVLATEPAPAQSSV